MKKQNTLTLSEEMIDRLKKLPLTRSAAIAQSIYRAAEQPELMALALKLRLSQPNEVNTVTVSYSMSERINNCTTEIANRVRLSREEAVRLALEAYVYKL